MLSFHVLRDGERLYLLDAGFIGGRALLRSALRKAGWDRFSIAGIIVTHGHLDHILNVSRLARETGAWIAAPKLDAAFYAGTATYPGWSRAAGILEAIGRPLLGYQPFTPDRWLEDGDELDLWHCLRVVHLPGHTPGHCGFYCEKLKLMFASDLFASYGRAELPPVIFNHDPAQIPASVVKALGFDLTGVIPNHGDCATPEIHLERMRGFADSR